MMLPGTTQHYSSFIDTRPFTSHRSQPGNLPAHNAPVDLYHGAVADRLAASSSGETPEPEGTADTPLEDAARAEREYVRQRLREELRREPTEEETDQWLREHTEGY